MSYKHPRLRGYKATDTPGVLVACDIDDPAVVRVDVAYPNSYGLSLEFKDLYLAYQVARAIDDSIEQGKRDKLAELRNFLGIHYHA